MLLVSSAPSRPPRSSSHLREEEIEPLSLEMAQTARGPAATRARRSQRGRRETARRAASTPRAASTSPARCSSASLGPERAAEIIGRLAAIIETRPFEFLRRTPPDQIAAFLQTSRRRRSRSSSPTCTRRSPPQVLAQLPPEQQAEIALRIATMNETWPEVIKDVEAVIRAEALQRRLAGVRGRRAASSRSPTSSTRADRSTERNVLDQLDRPQRRARRGGPLAAVRLRGHREDRRPRLQLVLRRSTEGPGPGAARRARRRQGEGPRATCPQRGAEMLLEEIEFQPPQRRRSSRRRRAGSSASSASSRTRARS